MIYNKFRSRQKILIKKYKKREVDIIKYYDSNFTKIKLSFVHFGKYETCFRETAPSILLKFLMQYSIKIQVTLIIEKL